MSAENVFNPNAHENLEVSFVVERISDGLGFGYGSISAFKLEAAEGNGDLAALTDEAIRHPDFLSPISRDDDGRLIKDDGCGDGRRTGLVFRRSDDEQAPGRVYYKSSLLRSKVFGGGQVMAGAAEIALGRADGLDVENVFGRGRETLSAGGLDYGAHTAMHAHEGKTGCGAIDYAPAILVAAVTYRDEIRSSIEALVGPAPELEADADGNPGILDRFAAAAAVDNTGYDSRRVMEATIIDGKIVKALSDDHMETRIILNDVPGYTADQGFVREYTGGRAQVFSVDVWRMAEIAEAMADDPAGQRRAFLGELVYTLATAAVLTKGDLPVEKVSRPA